MVKESSEVLTHRFQEAVKMATLRDKCVAAGEPYPPELVDYINDVRTKKGQPLVNEYHEEI